MKRRVLSFACALTLCLGLLTCTLRTRAATTPYFMAVNETLLPLEAQFMPIAVDGEYYIPYTVLSNSSTGVDLGINTIHNTAFSTVTIYTLERSLTFNLITGTCTNRDGGTFDARPIIRDGRIYMPARLTSTYFGLTYSTQATPYGAIVRIRSAASRMDDDAFESNARLQMETRLQEWRRAQSLDDVPAATPSPTPTSAPTPTPSTDKSGVRMYLAYRADRTDGLEKLLELLEQYQLKALFFFPAEELADHDESVRRVLCGGHAVGLLLSGSTAEEIAGQAELGDRLLAQIAYLNTNTVLVPNAAEDVRQEIERNGLFCLRPDVDALPDGRTAASQTDALLDQAGRCSSKAFILSDASAGGAALMGRLLPALVQDRYDIRLAVETEF